MSLSSSSYPHDRELPGNSLVVQWLKLYTFTAKGLGLIPGQGIKIPQVTCCSKKTKRPTSVCVCVFSFSVVSDFVTPWTVAPQAPLSMGFSRQEYWSGLPFPPPRDLPDPGIEPGSPESPIYCIGRWIFCHCGTWEAPPFQNKISQN